MVESNPQEVLATTSYAASYSDRAAALNPTTPPPSKLNEKTVPATLEGIVMLTRAGTWRAALRLVDQLIASGTANQTPPHIALQLSELRIIIACKLRLYKSASEEFARLGDLNDPKYCFESYPEQYPSLSGSFVPFSLSILQSELPSYQGNSSLTIDSLYSLLSICERQIQNYPEVVKASGPEEVFDMAQVDAALGGSVPLEFGLQGSYEASTWPPAVDQFASDLAAWRQRYNTVSMRLVCHCVREKEYKMSLQVLEDLLERYPTNSVLHSAVGRLFLQIGVLPEAEAFFQKAVDHARADNVEDQILLLMNRGSLQAAQGQYHDAGESFSEVIRLSPNHMAATNNKAVCLVYECQLTKAIHLLEDFIASDPSQHLTEIIVHTLTNLYDLHSIAGAEKKARLIQLVAEYGSDSFDHSMIKKK